MKIKDMGILPKEKTEEDFLEIVNPDRQGSIGEFTYAKNGMNYIRAIMNGYNQALFEISNLDVKLMLDADKIEKIISDFQERMIITKGRYSNEQIAQLLKSKAGEIIMRQK